MFNIGFPQSLVLANLLVSQNKAQLKIEETQGFIVYKMSHSLITKLFQKKIISTQAGI